MKKLTLAIKSGLIIDNGDGVKQKPERGFADITVKLFLDADHNGITDSNTALKQTEINSAQQPACS